MPFEGLARRQFFSSVLLSFAFLALSPSPIHDGRSSKTANFAETLDLPEL